MGRTNILRELPLKLGHARTLAHPSAAKHLKDRCFFFSANERPRDWDIFG
jgi:hypothetical protein